MIVFAAVLLLLNAAYNAVVWPQFFKRVKADERAFDAAGKATAFFRVHAVLIGIALAIAVASAIGGVWLLIAG